MEKYLLQEEKILTQLDNPALVICPTCSRVIPAKYFVKSGFRYLLKKCPFDDTLQISLIEKMEKWGRQQKINLEEWSHFKLRIGQRTVTEGDIENFQNIQNILFLLTYSCNSNCKICYIINHCKSKREMSIDTIKEKLKFFKNKQIYLYGGEPTVRRDLPQIITEIRKSDNYPILFTNGLKLADMEYLRTLERGGLSHINLSFDGFDENIYTKIRGGKHEYPLKLKALENLRKSKMRVVIQTTLVRGINDDQVKNILNYATENEFISEVSFRPLYLPGASCDSEFGESHLLSNSEINELVCKALDNRIGKEHYRLWYSVRLKFSMLLRKAVKANINPPQYNHLYLKRKNGEFYSFFELKELEYLDNFLTKVIEKNYTNVLLDLPKLLKPKFLKMAFCFIKNRFIATDVEKDVFDKEKIFRISIGKVRLPSDLGIESIIALFYSPDGDIITSSTN